MHVPKHHNTTRAAGVGDLGPAFLGDSTSLRDSSSRFRVPSPDDLCLSLHQTTSMRTRDNASDNVSCYSRVALVATFLPRISFTCNTAYFFLAQHPLAPLYDRLIRRLHPHPPRPPRPRPWSPDAPSPPVVLPFVQRAVAFLEEVWSGGLKLAHERHYCRYARHYNRRCRDRPDSSDRSESDSTRPPTYYPSSNTYLLTLPPYSSI